MRVRPAGEPSGTSRRATRRRRGDPWRAAFFGVLILAILAGAGWALLGSSLLVVRHVEVTGNQLVPAAQVRGAAESRPGSRSRGSTPPRPRAGSSGSRPCCRPGEPVLARHDRHHGAGAHAGLAVAAAGGYDLVDEYGVTVRWAARKPAGLPLLTAPPAVLRGSPDVRAAALVLRQLPRALRAEGRVGLGRVGDRGHAAAVRRDHGALGRARSGSPEGRRAELLLRKHARFYDVSDPSTAVTQG